MNDQFVLLLLEDSEEDIFLFQRAVAKVGRSVAFQFVRNGIEDVTLQILFRSAPHFLVPSIT